MIGGLVKRLFKFLLSLAILIGLLFLGLNYYFRHVSNFHARLMTRVQQVTQAHNIHTLTYAQIPPTYRNAVIATEDRRFAWDPGLDPIGMARSLIADVQQDGYVEGGSTITQQIVDNTFIHRQKSIGYKATQIFYAIGIYDTVHKDQTFAIYANVIYFGQGAYGLYNAAETYFGRPPSQLNSGELTMLAGLPNAPSTYDPFHNMKLARQRQSVVLENMVDDGLITKQASAKIFAEPIRLKPSG